MIRPIAPAFPLLLCLLGSAGPALASPGAVRTVDTAPEAIMTGTGVPYLRTINKLISAAATIHIRARMMTKAITPDSAKHSYSATIEIAMGTGDRFKSSAVGSNGKVIVGTGKSLFVYSPMSNSYIQEDNYPPGTGPRMVQTQIGFLLGPGAPAWQYKGQVPLEGHTYNLVESSGTQVIQDVYIDTTTHLPYHVSFKDAGARGTATFDVTFDQFDLNSTIPDSVFQFTPPDGARLIKPAP